MGLRNYSFLCCSLFFLSGCFIVSVDAQCDGESFTSNITILDLNGTINFELSDRQNLSSYLMNITYSWDVHVPEGDNFDGFIYCFVDTEKNTELTFNDNGLYPSDNQSWLVPNGLDDIYPTPFTNCPNYDGEYWLTYENGTYGNCSYPCSDVVNISCMFEEPLSCLSLKKNECLPLPRYQRNVTLRVEFGRIYRFSLIPYEGHFTYEFPVYSRGDVSFFCGHHFIENENIRPEAAYEFCRVNQSIAKSRIAAGPPANFHYKIINYNPIEKTVTVELSWRTPYDVAPNVTIQNYFIRSTEQHREFARVVAKSPEEEKIDPIYTYNLTFDGINSNKTIEITLSTVVIHKAPCNFLYCSDHGAAEMLVLEIEAYSPCLYFCDPNANCSESEEEDDELMAKCSCFVGYKGNGISSNLSIGTGCQNFNACVDAVENFCSSEAICTDAPPPSLDVLKCTCRNNYFGDGRTKGSGCIHIAFPIAFGLLGCFFFGALIIFSIYKRRSIKEDSNDRTRHFSFFYRYFKNENL